MVRRGSPVRVRKRALFVRRTVPNPRGWFFVRATRSGAGRTRSHVLPRASSESLVPRPLCVATSDASLRNQTREANEQALKDAEECDGARVVVENSTCERVQPRTPRRERKPWPVTSERVGPPA